MIDRGERIEIMLLTMGANPSRGSVIRPRWTTVEIRRSKEMKLFAAVVRSTGEADDNIECGISMPPIANFDIDLTDRQAIRWRKSQLGQRFINHEGVLNVYHGEGEGQACQDQQEIRTPPMTDELKKCVASRMTFRSHVL